MSKARSFLHQTLTTGIGSRRTGRLRNACIGISLVSFVVSMSFFLHFNLSTAGSIQLLLVLLVALRWGFFQATVVSVTGVLWLNYLFTPPVFKLTVADPQNWISLATFEITAVIVSGLSSKVRLHAEQVELQHSRAMTLYELSRAILLIDGRASITDQLSKLIREFIAIDEVKFWVVYDGTSQPSPRFDLPQDDSTYKTYLSGIDSEDALLRTTRRVLHLGTTPIGAVTLRGWEHDPLLADAVASLAAIALERARAIQSENRAEAERNTEQLRTAVLDGLAHGFKTPLTAIRTASSGLLAIDHMSATQAELVSIIDEEATMLSQLTTRLLQTAALESREIRLRRTEVSILDLLQNVLGGQDAATRERITVKVSNVLESYEVDASMVELALLQLIDNALKYSAVASAIHVSIAQSELETSVVVENSGVSINLEEKELIFQRFYRGTDAVRGPAGTGLGLSIVKKTAEAHGGRAWVECEAGVTAFHFTMQHYRKAKNG